MGAINVVPTILIQNFLIGKSVTGVLPAGSDAFGFAYDNLAVASFQRGEDVTWGVDGVGIISQVTETPVDGGSPIGTMVVIKSAGSDPLDNDAIVGGDSTATADIDGDPVDATDSEETIQRGRYREYIGLSTGGLVEIPVALRGFRIVSFAATLPGVTAINLFIVDAKGVKTFVGAPTVASGNAYQEFRNGGLLVAPDCKLQVVCTTALTGAGQFMLAIGTGWRGDVFDGSPALGQSNTPPGMQRPEQ